MKTNLKVATYVRLLLVVLTVSVFGCKDDEDPDPRQAFVGEYEMDDLEIRVFTSDGTDSTFDISNNSEIEFEMKADLDPDELEVDPEELLEDIIKESLKAFLPSIAVSVGLDEEAIVEISGNEFELDSYEFDITLSNGGTSETLPCEIDATGELDGNLITMEFQIVIFVEAETITFEGEIEGERK